MTPLLGCGFETFAVSTFGLEYIFRGFIGPSPQLLHAIG
jgi:hypothetical protein